DARADATARCRSDASSSASYCSTDTSTASALRWEPTKTAEPGDRLTWSSAPASPARNSRNDITAGTATTPSVHERVHARPQQPPPAKDPASNRLGRLAARAGPNRQHAVLIPA